MNHTSSVSMNLEKAIQGFMQAKAAEGCSENTIITYEQHLRVWKEHAGEVRVAAITTQDIRAFLAWLRVDYKPKRFGGRADPLSAKTVHNFWITLSAFFTWAAIEFDLPSPAKAIPAPSFEEAPVEPYTQEEVERLLKACDYTAEARTQARHKFTMRRALGPRDRAIVLTLLDTGLRASEICALLIGDVDQKTGKVDVKHGQRGGAKGGKGRTVYLGKVARRQLWRYLAGREDGESPMAPLFMGKFGRPINKAMLRILIVSLGRRAGVKKSHPHRFRHTFAITYLRSGGDIFTLQKLLGHGSLDIVQHYAKLAEVDIQQAHRRASPADNWRL